MTGVTGGNNYTLQSDAGLLTVSGNFMVGGGADRRPDSEPSGSRKRDLYRFDQRRHRHGQRRRKRPRHLDPLQYQQLLGRNHRQWWNADRRVDHRPGSLRDNRQWNRHPGSTTVNATGSLDLDGLGLVEPIILNGGTLTNSASGTATVVAGVKGVGYSTTTPGVGAGSTISFGSGAAAATPLLGVSAASFTITSSGYTAVPTVTITPSDSNGSGATATAALAAGGAITITISNPGTGYDAAPNISFSGGTGGTASGVGNAANFALVGIQMGNASSGYAAAPTATLNNGSGEPASSRSPRSSDR